MVPGVASSWCFKVDQMLSFQSFNMTYLIGFGELVQKLPELVGDQSGNYEF